MNCPTTGIRRIHFNDELNEYIPNGSGIYKRLLYW